MSILAGAKSMGKLAGVVLVLIGLVLSGCGDDPASGSSGKPPSKGPNPPAAAPLPEPGASSGAAARHGAGAPSGSATADMPPLPPQEFTEGDFTETDKSRDPFRSFAKAFVAQSKGRTNIQRVILAERYALDELKPVGIVSRGDLKALLTDPAGLGWIVKVGDYVGKAELVHTGGPTGSDVAINWRVDRIRENDIVFMREDTAHPEIPQTSRVVVLYPSDQLPGK
jgi:type IV pilus assembly protein PilP